MVPLKHAAPARSASKVRALAATIREDDVRAAALRTLARNGFRVSPAAVRAETGSWERLGLELRDTVFPARTRALLGGDATDIRSADETLWERLPRVAGFAYRHAEVLGGLQRAPPSSTVRHQVGIVAALFNVAISLFDNLVDEHGRVDLFEVLDGAAIDALLAGGPSARRVVMRARSAEAEPLVRATIELIGVCAAEAQTLRSRNGVAYERLAGLVRRAYAAQAIVASGRPRTVEELRALHPAVEAKSVTPSQVVAALVALPADPGDASLLGTAGEALGQVVWRADELADFVSDYRRLVASSLVLAVADEAFGRRGTPLGGSDLAPVLETYARDLTRRLEPKCFGSDTETAAPVAAFARVAVASWLGSSGVDGPGP